MSATAGPLRVVVVDDERLIADTLGDILEKHGLEVTVCYDPLLAMTAGKVLEPQVLISDVVMPHMNGFELARHYAEHHPDCKVLLLSGSAASSLLAREAQASGPMPKYLEKPVHPSVILAFVDSCAAPV